MNNIIKNYHLIVLYFMLNKNNCEVDKMAWFILTGSRAPEGIATYFLIQAPSSKQAVMDAEERGMDVSMIFTSAEYRTAMQRNDRIQASLSKTKYGMVIEQKSQLGVIDIHEYEKEQEYCYVCGNYGLKKLGKRTSKGFACQTCIHDGRA